MTTQQMQYFLTLANNLNYTNAASELQISVSTLSRQIVLIENELNVNLFNRDNHKVSLTTCGRFFYKEISIIYDKFQTVVDGTRQIYQGYSGAVNIGILFDITLNGPLQNHFHNFRKTYPNLKINLERGSYRQLTDGLLSGKYDCIISFFFSLQNIISLQYKMVEPIKEGILISSKNHLAKSKYFEPEKFKNQTFILISPDENDYFSNGPYEYLKRHNFHPNIIFAPNLDAATLMVESGLGVAFSYSKSIGAYNPAMTFLPSKDDDVMTNAPSIVIAWDEKMDNQSAKLFIRELVQQRF